MCDIGTTIDFRPHVLNELRVSFFCSMTLGHRALFNQDKGSNHGSRLWRQGRTNLRHELMMLLSMRVLENTIQVAYGTKEAIRSCDKVLTFCYIRSIVSHSNFGGDWRLPNPKGWSCLIRFRYLSGYNPQSIIPYFTHVYPVPVSNTLPIRHDAVAEVITNSTLTLCTQLTHRKICLLIHISNHVNTHVWQ